ncbi:unnamed protein product [Heligmosomoides polygyrus]|uniref:Reverse transcriptase domain-containing protein n=1 Tax=Heligmosomoides polygyrus TaxID=6339 RepID=A0A183FRA0_HELPZ|nr:unnamed protein product [Heligmosomoides polygyrus]
MRGLEWEHMGVKVDGRQLHHLRFADDIVLITSSISQAERMLADFDRVYGNVGLQLNLTKTMFMRNGQVSCASFSLNGTNTSECSSYTVEEVAKKTKVVRLRAHLFDSTVLPALTYASETWAIRKQDEHAISVAQHGIERTMLGVTRLTQVREGLRSCELRRRSKIRDDVAWAKLFKIRWAGDVMCFVDTRPTRAVTDWISLDVKSTPGRPPTRWSDFFVKALNDRYDALRVPRARRIHWSTLARDRDKRRRCWRPLDQVDDQRDDR